MSHIVLLGDSILDYRSYTNGGPALIVFNDANLRVGISLALSVMNLRLTCTSPEDCADTLGPSLGGRAKIARSIVARACGPDRRVQHSQVFAQ